MVDVQGRLLKAKSEWAAKLEDFGHKISSSSTHATTGTSNISSSNVQTNKQPQQTKVSTAVTPFRVLLQLFAYEDVLENGRLDAAFDLDDGDALTFYVPQLLSFLLHGALYCSPVLEEWILTKCRRNIYFAHRCFWFLRAWCLEAPADARATPLSMSRRGSHNSLTNAAAAAALNSNGNAGLQPFLDEPASSEAKSVSSGSCLQRAPDPRGLLSSTAVPSNHQLTSSSSVAGSSTAALDKFLPEERAMIERLMMRVKECGEEPARRVERMGDKSSSSGGTGGGAAAASFAVSEAPSMDEADNFVLDATGASLDSKKDVNGNAAYEQIHSPPRTGGDAVDLLSIPRRDGLTRRLHSGSSTRSRSISPPPASRSSLIKVEKTSSFDYDCSPAAMLDAAESGKLPVDPGTGYPSVKHFDAMVAHKRGYGFRPSPERQPGGPQHHSETEHFDKTPQFLDALIFLAENLFLIPREERAETLRQQLRSLECELLPSNSVYLPIGNPHHRVWRVVPEESISINTKERVPCIVALEVIDSTASSSKKRREPRGPWNALLGLPKRTARAVTAEITSTTPSLVASTSASHHTAVPSTPPPTTTLNSAASMPVSSSTHTNNSTESTNPVGVDSTAADTVPESEIVAQWRYGHRDPLRRVSLLDKVTTTVKVPFDKMKTQVRDHFNHLRDRGSIEEMQALSWAEYLVDPEQPPLSVNENGLDTSGSSSRGVEIRPYTVLSEAEQGTAGKSSGSAAGGSGTPTKGHSRTNSTGSVVSLGQWSSPAVPGKPMKDNEIRRNLNDLRARLDAELPSENKRDPARSKNSPLPYGSDQEDDPTERSASSHGKRPPRAQKSRSITSTEQGDTATKSTRPPPVVFRESWVAKQERIRKRSAFGDHPGWRLLPIMIKANDDLRQEQLASQLIQRMAAILAREKVPVWLCPYEIIALTDRAGIIEAIPDTISLDSLKKNGEYTNLRDFFHTHFGEETEELAGAKANFVESLAAYSIVCFLLQIKDRHNGNILLDKNGHIIHIDWGFFFLSSPGKNVGFESAPFKLTRDFVEVLDGPDSHLFRTFRELCVKTFITLRKRCMEIILLVEMLKNGNEELQCFRGRPDDAIQQLRERFRLDLNDRACREYVQSLVDDSIENWRTDWYDRYQRYFVGVL